MRIRDMTWMQVEMYLAFDDRCVIPLGSVEQHAYLSLAVDAILSERVAVDAAEPLGIPVFPALAYGITPYFMAYPGTVTLTPKTYQRVLKEILDSVYAHGFRRIAVVNGHGGNRVARASAERWAKKKDGARVLWHDWWAAPDTMAAVRAIDEDASHASWMEGFAWTRVDAAEPPDGHKAAVDLSDRDDLSSDGSFGGYYTRPEEDLDRVWAVAVDETRALIGGGWA